MRTAETLTIAPGATGCLFRHMPFLEGTFIATVFPISTDETTQVTSQFSAVIKWSPNNKFWISEPITEGVLTSNGESLVTLVQAPNVRVEVTNNSGTQRKFYVTVATVETAS